jgi:hypothetical protein
LVIISWQWRKHFEGFSIILTLLTLDGVAPLMTDPPPISSTTLSEKKKKKKKKKKNKKIKK